MSGGMTYNFQERFAEDVRQGRKLQTIRACRKDGRVPQVGMPVTLYTGMRTKACRLLGRGAIIYAAPITIHTQIVGPTVSLWIGGDGVVLMQHELERLICLDGFATEEEFFAFFPDYFEGYVIQWRLHK